MAIRTDSRVSASSLGCSPSRRRHRGLRAGLAALLLGATTAVALLGVGVHTAPPASAAPGLYVYPMSGTAFGVRAPIHLVTFFGSAYTLQIGLAHNSIDGGVETASAICKATAGCVAAVNGDYFDVSQPGKPDPGDDVGGIIRSCVLLHTPEVPHQQADLDGESLSNGFNWSSSLEVNGTTVAISAINQELPLSYVGVHIALTGTELFTPPYKLSTPSAPGRVTYEFQQVNATASPTTINTTTTLQLVARTTKALKVRAGRVDVSAPLSSPLATLAVGATVSLTTASTAGCDSVGGHPDLVESGVPVPISRADTYMTSPSARTVIGWTASGETVVMTVGGVDGRSGATGAQLDNILLSLDVETAIDLDGGTSTTLFANGRVLYPTGRSERSVSTALLVVSS
jgi:exopolysaccharide biosynthesis protein